MRKGDLVTHIILNDMLGIVLMIDDDIALVHRQDGKLAWYAKLVLQKITGDNHE